MGYWMDLDEYSERALQEELDQRLRSRRAGLCDYCHRRPSTPSCKEHQRHRDESIFPSEPCPACGGSGNQGGSYCRPCQGKGIDR